jgi:hypothetical protein
MRAGLAPMTSRYPIDPAPLSVVYSQEKDPLGKGMDMCSPLRVQEMLIASKTLANSVSSLEESARFLAKKPRRSFGAS